MLLYNYSFNRSLEIYIYSMSTVLSLFEKLGGSTAVDAVVQKFYEYMLADKKVNHYFEHVDMTKQRLRQV